ncbi:MAG TPA: enolase C-terminal domain-like protein [Steroidobacteraceae bacterium]
MAEFSDPLIADVDAAAYRIPTDAPEADGTYAWDATILIVVNVHAGGRNGIGYTYADASVAPLVRGPLARTIKGRHAFDIPGCWAAMQSAIRNLGRSGLAACALSGVDAALWDLKSQLLDLPLALLLGRCRDEVPIYGSGGFTTYSDERLRTQLGAWAERDGCRFVKMKIGSDPDRDPHRALVAKSAIGNCQLFVDANGAFSLKQALRFLRSCPEADIRWFEEPVTADDPDGLRLMRQHAPRTEIAAGEYIYTVDDAERLLRAGAVDVLQSDVTRCGGITGFLKIAALCDTHHLDLSGHCAPALHRHVGCAIPRLRHLEWFHDHVRIEQMLFDGAPVPANGTIRPDLTRAGHGIEFKARDAEAFRIGDGDSS